jgi:sulfoacetaldehyde acetyltransferase
MFPPGAPCTIDPPANISSHPLQTGLTYLGSYLLPSGAGSRRAAFTKVYLTCRITLLHVGPCGYGFPAIIGAKIGNPDVPGVGFAGDGAFGISMSEMSSIGRAQWPGVTMVIFRNYQWGAEKRNSILWYDNNFVGTELDPRRSYARVAEACGFNGVVARTPSELTEALRRSCDDQKRRVTTFIEAVLNQELGEPFRRDAMKKPVVVAGIQRDDLRPQTVS